MPVPCPDLLRPSVAAASMPPSIFMVGGAARLSVVELNNNNKEDVCGAWYVEAKQ